MCGRFYVESDDTAEDLLQLLRQAGAVASGEVRPGDQAAAVALSRKAGQIRAFSMRWGFPVSKQLVINARSETACQKPLFRESWEKRRCLIPASAWFEWDHRRKPMDKYRLQPEGAPWFFLAGLYRFGEDGQPEFTVLTRPATESLAALHDRMPVVFGRQDAQRWLSVSTDPDEMMPEALTEIRFAPVQGNTGTADQPMQLSFFEQ